MAKGKVIQERIHETFLKELDEISDFRYKHDLDDDAKARRRPLSKAEVTRMLPNAVNWQKVKEEAKIKPRKKDE